MPFIPAAIAAISANAVLSFVVKLGISYAIGKIQQNRMKKKMEAMQKSAISSVMINTSSNSDPIPVVYGRTRIGGVRSIVETTDGAGDSEATEYLNLTITFSEGRISTIKQLYFDDVVVWDADAGGLLDNGNIGVLSAFDSDTDYAPALNDTGSTITFYDGLDDQAADPTLVTSIAEWTTAHRMRGISYLSLKLKANADVYKGGLPLMTAVIEGRYMADVDSITDGDTTRTLVNSGADPDPVDVLYDYLTNTRYGKGLDHTTQDQSLPDAGYQAGLHIDIASFQVAKADIGGYFKINGAVNTSELIYNNVGEMLESMNGMLVFQNGKYKLKIKQQNEPSVMTLGYNDIIGSVGVELPGKQNKFNRMKADFRNKTLDTDYNDDIVVVENATYLSDDNDQILEGRLRLDYVDDPDLVSDITTYTMDESRYNTIVTFETAHHTLKIECGDIITLQLEDFGWGDGKDFRVTEMSITGDDTISFIAQEYESSIQLI